MVATVDDADFEWLSQWSWFTCNGYACRHGDAPDQSKFIYMHRQILSAPKGLEVDHADGNKVNNQRGNIRCCTSTENKINQPAKPSNKTGLKGVAFDSQTGKYRSQIRVFGKRVELGRFPTPQLAHAAYCKAALENHGEFART